MQCGSAEQRLTIPSGLVGDRSAFGFRVTVQFLWFGGKFQRTSSACLSIFQERPKTLRIDSGTKLNRTGEAESGVFVPWKNCHSASTSVGALSHEIESLPNADPTAARVI